MSAIRNGLTSYLRQHLALYAVVVLYLLAAGVGERVSGIDLVPRPVPEMIVGGLRSGLVVLLITLSAVLAVFVASRVVFAVLPAREGRSTWRDYRKNITPERLAGLFTVWMLLTILLEQFVALKSSIPLIHPFAWDVRLMELDRLLHFNQHPWELIQPLLGRPLFTEALDSVYYAWFLVNGIIFYWMGWRRWDALRGQYFLAYFLVWVMMGTGMALMLSSAGPVYFEAVVGAEGPFRGLIAYLHSVGANGSLTALEIHEMLWMGYIGEAPGPVEGISAMPSIHVAMPVLQTFLAFRFGRWLGIPAAIYSALILVGSVHLGWHYAVDGYVSILTVPLIWILSGSIAARFMDETKREDPADVAVHPVEA